MADSTPAVRQRLKGKVAVVTGGGRGIGRAEAMLLAREGASVVVNDLGGDPEGGGADPSFARAVVDEIRATGGMAIAETSGIDSMQGAEALVNVATHEFGGVDILVNNAGIVRPIRIDQMSQQDWESVLAVNLTGYFAMIRHVASVFIRQRSGVIVNTSSPSGFGHYAMANYVAAKEGVIGLTRAVARDLGQFGVRCNAIRPQSAPSGMAIDKTRAIPSLTKDIYGTNAYMWNRSRPPVVAPKPENVAALAVWLCTDAATGVNGREFFISGGEVGLLPEPELMRACFHPDGWDLESFDDEGTREYLIGDVRNRFPARASR